MRLHVHGRNLGNGACTVTDEPNLLDYIGRARHSDPDTSKEAAHHARAFASKQHKQIIDALFRSPRPLAAEEIANELGWADHVPANRRTSELERAGMIEVVEGNFHINTRSGRRARRYRLKAQS